MYACTNIAVCIKYEQKKYINNIIFKFLKQNVLTGTLLYYCECNFYNESKLLEHYCYHVND